MPQWTAEEATTAVTAEQANVSQADTEQTEAEWTERARRQYLSDYERRRALPEASLDEDYSLGSFCHTKPSTTF